MGISGIGELVWPVIVAHRGASSSLPDNTIAAFDAAALAGADIVELDVRCTLDNTLVVLHDPTVSIPDGNRANVHELTFADLRGIDAAAGRGPKLRVPTLAEALAAISGRAGVDIEIKNIPGEPGYDGDRERIAEQVVKLLDEIPFDGALLVSSFHPGSIARVRERSPATVTGFLSPAALDPRSALDLAVGQGHAFVLPPADIVEAAGEEFAAACRAAGVRLGTWTVDDPDRIARLFSMGVDAVATNDPAAAIPVRDAARAAGQP
jgi:glycerophosphoryl diester phosphodiesterase